MAVQFGDLKLLSGNSNPALAQSVAQHLGMSLCEAHIKRFSDGESFVRIEENIRGTDVFIIQSTCSPANDNIMELLVMIDALKRASARRITAVIPYYGYARQDRKDSPRTPISARLVADLLQAAGAHRVFCLDLHAAQIQGFFNIPVDHLFAAPVLVPRIKEVLEEKSGEAVLISPDAGGVERARAYGKRLNCAIAVVDKRRESPGQIAEVNVIGDVQGKQAIILDDIIDTAGTMQEVARVVMKQGAQSVWAVATHGVFSGPATQRLNDSPLERILVTDTIPLGAKQSACPKIEVLSVAPLLADAIKRIHGSDSVSSLFV
jgi:ribose-phosphate pyrophosphokinase